MSNTKQGVEDICFYNSNHT